MISQTTLINRAHTRTDALNLTNIFDNVTPANNAALWYSPANRLQNADGPWGSETFYYDGVGNRIEHRATPPGGSQTIATLGYPATSNRVTQITQNATTVRSIGHDAAGNITSDSRLGSVYAYTYNKANRLKTVSYEGNLKATYTYNGLHQLIKRVVTNSGSLDGTMRPDRPSIYQRGRESAAQTIAHYVHDRSGNPGLRRGRLNRRAERGGGHGARIHLAARRSDRFAFFHAKRESAAPNKEQRSRRQLPRAPQSTGRWLWSMA